MKFLIGLGYATALFLFIWGTIWAIGSIIMLHSVEMYPNTADVGSGLARVGLMLLYAICIFISCICSDEIYEMNRRLVTKFRGLLCGIQMIFLKLKDKDE